MERFPETDLVAFDEGQIVSKEQCLQRLIGKPVAVMCARFVYRGILKGVTQDAIVLGQARAVESSGPSQGDAPRQEDKIGPIMISMASVEMVFQPRWCLAPL